MKDEILVLESPRRQDSLEEIPWAFNYSGYLGVGEVPTDPVSELLDKETGESYVLGLNGAPTTDGVSKVTQTVVDLVPGHNYLLKVNAAIGARRMTLALELSCPF